MIDTTALLHEAGLKVTPGRLRVLEIMGEAAQPMCHADIEALLPDVDRVTLYRILDSLVACGIALKAVDPRGVFRYSVGAVRQEHRNHVHFRCTGCGGVFCLKAVPPAPPKLPRGFRLDAMEVDISGLCAGCRKQQPGRAAAYGG